MDGSFVVVSFEFPMSFVFLLQPTLTTAINLRRVHFYFYQPHRHKDMIIIILIRLRRGELEVSVRENCKRLDGGREKLIVKSRRRKRKALSFYSIWSDSKFTEI